MAQPVDVPGIGVVEFPDNMTDTQISAAIRNNLKAAELQAKPSMALDVAKQVASAPSRGLYGLGSDVLDLFRATGSMAARGVGGMFGLKPDEIRAAAGSNLASAPAPQFPRAETQTGKRIGAVADTTAVAGMLGGIPALFPGLLSGGASEGAGMLSNDNPWIKAAAGFVAPLAAGGIQAYRNAPAQMVREAIGPELTPQQIAQAVATQRRAQSQGISLMAPEVLPDSGIQQLASNVAASRAGNTKMNAFFANRPAEVRGAVDRGLISQVGTSGAPDANMRVARTAATDIIGDAEKARTAAVRPLYDAAAKDIVPPQEIQAIVAEANRRLALGGSKPTQAALRDIIEQVTGTNPNAAALDDVYKYFRESANVGINATAAEKASRGIYGPAAAQLDTALQSASPNISQGRSTYQQISQNVIDPLTAGPVGRVAGRHGVDPSLPESLSPLSAIANPQVARPGSIKELYTELNGKDPLAFQGMARTYLENAFDAAAKRIQGGENRMAGANFANAVMGTPQQEANFREVMRGVADAQGRNPDQILRGVDNLFEALRLTGKIPGMGSQTAPRLSGDAMAGKSLLGGAMEVPSGRPLGPFAEKVREWTMRGSYNKLADAMTSPDGVEMLAKMAKYNPRTTTGQYFAASLLGLTSSDQ